MGTTNSSLATYHLKVISARLVSTNNSDSANIAAFIFKPKIQAICETHRIATIVKPSSEKFNVFTGDEVLGYSDTEPLALAPFNRNIERPSWQADAQHCQNIYCAKTFTFFERRHHCRCCGQVVCGACSRDTVYLPDEKTGIEEQVRVCGRCNGSFEMTIQHIKLYLINIALSMADISFAQLISETRLDQHLEITDENFMVWVNSVNTPIDSSRTTLALSTTRPDENAWVPFCLYPTVIIQLKDDPDLLADTIAQLTLLSKKYNDSFAAQVLNILVELNNSVALLCTPTTFKQEACTNPIDFSHSQITNIEHLILYDDRKLTHYYIKIYLRIFYQCTELHARWPLNELQQVAHYMLQAIEHKSLPYNATILNDVENLITSGAFSYPCCQLLLVLPGFYLSHYTNAIALPIVWLVLPMITENRALMEENIIAYCAFLRRTDVIIEEKSAVHPNNECSSPQEMIALLSSTSCSDDSEVNLPTFSLETAEELWSQAKQPVDKFSKLYQSYQQAGVFNYQHALICLRVYHQCGSIYAQYKQTECQEMAKEMLLSLTIGRLTENAKQLFYNFGIVSSQGHDSPPQYDDDVFKKISCQWLFAHPDIDGVYNMNRGLPMLWHVLIIFNLSCKGNETENLAILQAVLYRTDLVYPEELSPGGRFHEMSIWNFLFRLPKPFGELYFKSVLTLDHSTTSLHAAARELLMSVDSTNLRGLLHDNTLDKLRAIVEKPEFDISSFTSSLKLSFLVLMQLIAEVIHYAKLKAAGLFTQPSELMQQAYAQHLHSLKSKVDLESYAQEDLSAWHNFVTTLPNAEELVKHISRLQQDLTQGLSRLTEISDGEDMDISDDSKSDGGHHRGHSDQSDTSDSEEAPHHHRDLSDAGYW